MDVHTATPEWAQELHAPVRKQRFVQNVPALVELAQESGLMHITREHLDGEPIEPPVVKQEATDLTVRLTYNFGLSLTISNRDYYPG
jgi:hypothetical protein